MEFLNRYIMTIMQSLALLILSLVLTDFYQTNVPMFFVGFAVIAAGNFMIESLYNKNNYEQQTKAKKMGMTMIPINTLVLLVFVMVLF